MSELLDLDLATAGYLRGPGGRLRYVQGLERLARDTLRAGAEVQWGELGPREAGYCDCRAGRIVLASWLFWCPPWFVRRVLSEELLHTIVGPSDERATYWQRRLYGDLIMWPEWV